VPRGRSKDASAATRDARRDHAGSTAPIGVPLASDDGSTGSRHRPSCVGGRTRGRPSSLCD
jgi:hypothetical protein